jgi:hypothetical protein
MVWIAEGKLDNLLPAASCVFGSRSVLLIATTDRIGVLLSLSVLLAPSLLVTSIPFLHCLFRMATDKAAAAAGREHHFPFPEVHFSPAAMLHAFNCQPFHPVSRKRMMAFP